MIELVNVSKSYKLNGVRKIIFDDLSFKFPERRNVAIMGKNGAGKSTLLKLIAGTELPDSGHVYRSVNLSWPLGLKGAFNGAMTGAQNVTFVARIYGQNTEYVIDYVKRFAEIGPYFNLPLKVYSSGMKARLAFGLSLALNFDCYLIDEIISVGDQRFKEKSKKAFRGTLKNANIIMVSHSQATIKDYCDCGLLLKEGAVFFHDNIDDLILDYKNSLDGKAKNNDKFKR